MFFLCCVIFSHSRQWPHVAHFERGRIPSQRMFFTESGRLTPMYKKQKEKQNNKHRQKQMEMLFFLDTYISLKFVVSYFSDNIFLRAAFGGAIEIPVTILAAPALVRVPVRVPLALQHSQMHRKVLQAREKVERSSSQEDATHRKYSKLEDHLILKALELGRRDWRTALAFLKSN